MNLIMIRDVASLPEAQITWAEENLKRQMGGRKGNQKGSLESTPSGPIDLIHHIYIW